MLVKGPKSIVNQTVSIADLFNSTFQNIPGFAFSDIRYDDHPETNHPYIHAVVDERYFAVKGLPQTFNELRVDINQWHRSVGQVQYDPRRPGMKTRTEWWVIINTDPGIVEYYKWWVKNRYWIELNQPSWGSHVSIVRGEWPRLMSASSPQALANLEFRRENFKKQWKRHNGEMAEFWYEHHIRSTKENFWWVDVYCPMAKRIRHELLLPHDWLFHLTCGRTYDYTGSDE